MSQTRSQKQTGAVARRAEQAVIERVAAAIENELPALRQELIMSEQGGRMYRLSHPTYLDEDVYVYVQVSAFGKEIAAKVLEDKGVPTSRMHRAEPPPPLITEREDEGLMDWTRKASLNGITEDSE